MTHPLATFFLLPLTFVLTCCSSYSACYSCVDAAAVLHTPTTTRDWLPRTSNNHTPNLRYVPPIFMDRLRPPPAPSHYRCIGRTGLRLNHDRGFSSTSSAGRPRHRSSQTPRAQAAGGRRGSVAGGARAGLDEGEAETQGPRTRSVPGAGSRQALSESHEAEQPVPKKTGELVALSRQNVPCGTNTHPEAPV